MTPLQRTILYGIFYFVVFNLITVFITGVFSKYYHEIFYFFAFGCYSLSPVCAIIFTFCLKYDKNWLLDNKLAAFFVYLILMPGTIGFIFFYLIPFLF